MNIAIDTSPTDASSGHKVRGVGMYISLLRAYIEKVDQENTYTFFNDIKSLGKNIDLIHFPYFDPFFITFPIFKKRKTIITIHDVIPLTHPKEFPVGVKGRLKWEVNKRILLASDGVVTDSEASKKALNKLVGYPNSKIHVAYLGVGDKFVKQAITNEKAKLLRKKYDLPERFLLYVGDVTWNKNLPRLVDAINELQNIPLVMVGKALTEKDYDAKNPWNRDRNYVVKHTDNKLFHKLGFLPEEDLVALYNTAEALIMPSLDEGFGLPVLEAMSCGCPVITSQEGSLPEVAGDAGLYVNAYSVEDIREKVSTVWGDTKLRIKMSEKSLTQAKKFSIKKMVEDTIKVYKVIHEQTS